jgi:glycine/D-amino acid oxidase-like deaminating enzyme
MSLPATADVVVVGAGLVGVLAALELAEAGRRVVVLEKSAFWREGSAVNAGTLALQNKPTQLLAAYSAALDLWDVLPDRLGAPLGRVVRGGYRVAQTDAECAQLAAAIGEQQQAGVAVELVQGNRLRTIAPWLDRSVQAAGFCARDGFASPLLTGEALLRAARKSHVPVVEHCALVAASRDGSAWRLATGRGVISCASVLVAAGPWSGDVAALFGMRLRIGLHANMLSVTPRLAPFMDNAVVTHIGGRLTLKQFANGTCLLGGGFQGIGDPASGRKELDFSQLRANMRLHCSVVPRLRRAALLRSWTGFTAAPADGLPAVGPLPGIADVCVAVTTGAGFTLGPLAARLAAQAVLGGRPGPDAKAFNPARLVE